MGRFCGYVSPVLEHGGRDGELGRGADVSLFFFWSFVGSDGEEEVRGRGSCGALLEDDIDIHVQE